MDELITWFATLDREFVFLLALPFAVAAAGGLVEGVRYLRRRSTVAPGVRDADTGDTQAPRYDSSTASYGR